MKKKPKTKRPGKVQKIIKNPIPDAPEKAEIAVEGADHLYREIRIENRLEDEQGKQMKLIAFLIFSTFEGLFFQQDLLVGREVGRASAVEVRRV
jgi:hypothetical protein